MLMYLCSRCGRASGWVYMDQLARAWSYSRSSRKRLTAYNPESHARPVPTIEEKRLAHHTSQAQAHTQKSQTRTHTLASVQASRGWRGGAACSLLLSSDRRSATRGNCGRGEGGVCVCVCVCVLGTSTRGMCKHIIVSVELNNCLR